MHYHSIEDLQEAFEEFWDASQEIVHENDNVYWVLMDLIRDRIEGNPVPKTIKFSDGPGNWD